MPHFAKVGLVLIKVNTRIFVRDAEREREKERRHQLGIDLKTQHSD